MMFFSACIFGQVGVSGGYVSFNADEWIDGINATTGENFSNLEGYQVGLDYWFRLKNKRVEFFPTLSYSAFDQSSNNSNMDVRLLGFHFNTNFYLFDFEGDCDCPTWSKQGGILEKGFFLQLSPGITNFDVKVKDENSIDGETVTFFDIGIGAGLDLGFSDFITITPLIRFHLSPNTDWVLHDDTATTELLSYKTSPKQLFAGIRLGINFKN